MRRTSFTNAALSTVSRSLHQRGGGTKVHVVAVDNGDAELASSVSTMSHDVERRLHGLDDVDALIVEPSPNRPPPGEIRMLVTPVGCPEREVQGADGW